MELLLPGVLRADLEAPVRALVTDATLRWYDEHAEPDGPIEQVEVFCRWHFPESRLASTIARMPHLRWLHVSRAGVEGSLIPAIRDSAVLLTNAAGMHAVPISEYVLWALLSHAKRARLFADQQRRHIWHDDERGLPWLEELAGKTLLIIGLGRIGVAIAQRARAFGMRVLASSRSGRPQEDVDLVVAHPDWRDLLPQADYLVLAAPLTPETRGMLGAAELAQLPPQCYVVNIARGGIIDEPALIEALRSGRIAGATLDVFEQEPLPADHPLWQLPTVTITPHMAWSSPMIRTRSLQIFLENLRAYVAGRPLPNLVDKQAGY